jgi:3'(2'), 5'-bisphosphate nucleotidase
MDIKILQQAIIDIAKAASARVMDIYNHPQAPTTLKSDGTPVTEADLASHQLITERLKALTPDIPIISEEEEEIVTPWKHQKLFWLVDPLDGTKEFIHRNGEFTVNIALIADSKPVLGVVSAPALNRLYAGTEHEAIKLSPEGNYETISTSIPNYTDLIMVGSRSHGDPTQLATFGKQQKISQFISVGSSLKFCTIAEGSAHLYPRFGPTMEWDTAAGHAVLLGAGGSVNCLDGNALKYGKKLFKNPEFIAKSHAVVLKK